MDRMHGWVGRNDRRPFAGDAVVRRSDGSELTVRLSDVSDEGCRIELDHDHLRIGEWVEIALPAADHVKAQVRWALGDSAGVKFETQENEAEEGL
jgi:hypothetical protein